MTPIIQEVPVAASHNEAATKRRMDNYQKILQQDKELKTLLTREVDPQFKISLLKKSKDGNRMFHTDLHALVKDMNNERTIYTWYYFRSFDIVLRKLSIETKISYFILDVESDILSISFDMYHFSFEDTVKYFTEHSEFECLIAYRSPAYSRARVLLWKNDKKTIASILHKEMKQGYSIDNGHECYIYHDPMAYFNPKYFNNENL